MIILHMKKQKKKKRENKVINLKTINHLNVQKIKLHETLTTKELNKHSSRPIGTRGGDKHPGGADPWESGRQHG